MTYIVATSPGGHGPDGPRDSLLLLDEVATTDPLHPSRGLRWNSALEREHHRDVRPLGRAAERRRRRCLFRAHGQVPFLLEGLERRLVLRPDDLAARAGVKERTEREASLLKEELAEILNSYCCARAPTFVKQLRRQEVDECVFEVLDVPDGAADETVELRKLVGGHAPHSKERCPAPNCPCSTGEGPGGREEGAEAT